MKAVQITEPDQVEMVELAMPLPEPDEVLIRSRAVGLGESDANLYHGTRSENFYRYPIVPGHAWSGEVVVVGERVQNVEPGSKAVVESLVFCGMCRNCRSGETNSCERGYDELGFTRSGGLAEYVTVPERLVHVLPHMASFEEGALLVYAATVAHAFQQARLLPGDTVAVVGDDVANLLAVQVAHLFSPTVIVMVGFREGRLELGRSFGATHTVNISREDPQALVRSLSSGRGADISFEGTGQAQAAVEAMLLARRGGTVLLEGAISSNSLLSVESDIFVRNQLRVLGILGANSAAWSYAVHLYQSGLLKLSPLISHHFVLSEYQDAFDTLIGRQGKTLQVVITLP